jgi:hypothetical protein
MNKKAWVLLEQAVEQALVDVHSSKWPSADILMVHELLVAVRAKNYQQVLEITGRLDPTLRKHLKKRISSTNVNTFVKESWWLLSLIAGILLFVVYRISSGS